MKKFLIYGLIVVGCVQSFHAEPAVAQVNLIPKVSRLAALKKLWPGVDMKFVMGLTLAIPTGFFMGEVGLPHVIKGLCALEAKTTGRSTILLKKDTCNLYYGDPKVNSCQVANNSVKLLIPYSKNGETAIQFTGTFDQGVLRTMSQVPVTINKKKETQVMGLPVEVLLDTAGLAVEVHPTPGTSVLKATATAEELDGFQFYDEVAAVIRLANTDCKEGKYNQIMSEIIARKTGPRPAVGVPASKK